MAAIFNNFCKSLAKFPRLHQLNESCESAPSDTMRDSLQTPYGGGKCGNPRREGSKFATSPGYPVDSVRSPWEDIMTINDA